MPSKTKGKAPAMPAQPKPLTPEEKQAQIARFLSTKREQYFQMYSGSIAHSLGFIPDKEEAAAIVDRAIEMADKTIEALFPLPKEEDGDPKPEAEE